MKAMKCYVALCIFLMPSSQAYNINLSHNISINEAQEALAHTNTNDSKLAELRDAFATIYAAAPKNKDGLLGHQTVRYVLHRFFQHRNGWFVKGLAPNETQTWRHGLSAAEEAPEIKEWVPSFLQDQLEQGSMHHSGTDIAGLARLAAALEELVGNEAQDKVRMAYEMHGWSEGPLTLKQAHAVIHTYFVAFLAGGKFLWQTLHEVDVKEEIFAHRQPNYKDLMEWMGNLEHSFLDTTETSISFESVVRLAVKIGEKYADYNTEDCRGMKHTLMGMESKKAGRVRLSTFYNQSFYSAWGFNEKEEYLKAIGALDDSDPLIPQVIVANYVLSRTNCLENSGVYAVCCRNECEDLVDKIESQFQSSHAKPSEIVGAVFTLTTDTVHAPRALGTELVSRLEQVAARNFGKVPIHGRLFAQWMHHAFPRECPYPHQIGSTTPLTPDEWMQSSGKGDSSASRQEMQQAVEKYLCEVDAEGNSKGPCKEDESLPWSDEEELLEVVTKDDASLRATFHDPEHQVDGLAIPLGVAFIALLALLLDYLYSKKAMETNMDEVFYVEKLRPFDLGRKFEYVKQGAGLWVMACVACALKIPDIHLFVYFVSCYIGILALRLICAKMFQRAAVHV